MASNTDTLPGEAGTAARPATGPPETSLPSRGRRGVFGWAAALAALVAAGALTVAVLAGGDADTPSRPFDPQAERYEREAHLRGQAHTYGADASADAGLPYGPAAGAERYEREAHLLGQAYTYGPGGHRADDAPSPEASGEDPGSDEFVPGSRHMPVR